MTPSIPQDLSGELGEAAVQYAEAGLPVLPLQPGGKSPLGKAAPKGCHSATTSVDQIRAWWSEHPDANIGLVTGNRSGLVVIDIDGPAGLETARKLELPSTLACETGRGEHRYFRAEAGTVRNGVGEHGGLGPGVDIRGEGGYVVAPPSIHGERGRKYRWVTTGPAEPLALPPAVLRDREATEPRKSVSEQPRGQHSAARRVGAPVSLLPPTDEPVGTRHGLQRLATQYRLLADERSPASGGNGRNQRLNEVSYICGQLVGTDDLDSEYAEMVILEAAEACGLVAEDGQAAVLRTFASGFSSGQGKLARDIRAAPGGWHRPQDLDQEAGGFRLLSLDDLRDLPPVEYLIGDVLPARGLVSLFGPPGSFKSFVALDWSLSVASGRSWAGRATRKGSAVYVAAEGSSGLWTRAKAWTEKYTGADPSDSFRVIPRAVRLNAPDDLTKLRQAFHEQLDDQPALVVIDTLARSAPGSEENSAKDMGLVVDAVDAIRHEFNSTVVLVHHTPRDAPTRERGSTALEGAMDMRWSITGQGDGATLTCMKAKEGEDGQTISVSMLPSAESLVVDTASDATARLRRARAERAARKALKEWREAGKEGWPSLSFARNYLGGRNEEKRRAFEEAGADPETSVIVRRDGAVLRIGVEDPSQADAA